jgi:hypothetical protein
MVDAMSGSDPSRERSYRTIVVVGGGCYGGYYVRQLGRAARAGAISWQRLLVVDRDASCAVSRSLADETWGGQPAPELVVDEWRTFFDRWLDEAADAPSAAANDALVPSPLMPHLLFDWMLARARSHWPDRQVTVEPLERAPNTPWERASPDGTHFVSFAEWMCPINCIEPARCPKTRDVRTWSMPVALRRHVENEHARGSTIAGPAIFHCTHRTYGVGMVDVRDVVDAEVEMRRLAERGSFEYLVGTVSHCHGAVNRMVVRQGTRGQGLGTRD